MELIPYDDITGDGAKHQLITLLKIGGVAVSQANWTTRWWQAVMVSASGVTRLGNSNVSATNGIPIGVSANGQFLPLSSQVSEIYDLSQVYVIIASGDVMSVARAV